MKKILLLLFISLSSRAEVTLIGEPTSLYDSLTKEYTESVNKKISDDVYYINVASMSLTEAKSSIKLIKDKVTTVIDMTEVYSEAERTKFSAKIIGLGVDTPVIVVGEIQGEKAINVVDVNIKDVNGNSINNDGEAQKSLTSSLVHVLERFEGKQ